MNFSPYCVPPMVLAEKEKQRRRDALRAELGVLPNETLLLFSGKLIEKKNPQLILESKELMPPAQIERTKIVFVGSGDLGETLKYMAFTWAHRVHFAGFVNQSKIADYYLAADILCLPSRRAGETWGLVVNEALQAGCAVIMTNAVGCHREFGDWERVRVIGEGDIAAFVQAVSDLAKFPRSFDWCAADMEKYSVRIAAEGIMRKTASVLSIARRTRAHNL